ncbi:hypothetical protein BaRGS_00033361 [Batillaria attramentaria]|uniref:L-xylulose reductase n=1 Tax=Batillaria attramentaria TaxID=370345 RepID=A0ABD0JL60_9CAEN
MDIRFTNKRALVTGAGKGIGRGVAIALHKAGAQTHPGIETVNLDIGDWSATRQVVSNLGHFDLLVNNAGVHKMVPFLEFPEEEIDRVFAINYKAAFNIAQVVARGMVERGTGGAIVNVSSDSSPRGFQGEAAYGPSKAAMDSLTRVMALELGPKKIRVNSVQPSLTRTPIIESTYLKDKSLYEPLLNRIPLGRISEVSDVTAAILFALSDQAAMIHGTALLVDGGMNYCG